jgi:diacylglycerol kinase (ATP)
MQSSDPSHRAPANPQKARSGLNRIWHATGYSIAGLRAGWNEKAFRQEALAALVLVPLSFWLGHGWVEVALLAGSVVIVMIVELLNTGIETAIDRIGPEWHDLSKRAKDMGSAAVLLSLLLCIGIWSAAILQRFFMAEPAFSICVYCGSRPGEKPAFAQAAAAVGQWIGSHGGQLVYGGGRSGLMGTVAEATRLAGGRVVGVIPQTLVDKELANHSATSCTSCRPCTSAKP